MGMNMVMVFMMALSGSGNDLLDFLPTQSYWKAKNANVTVESLVDELKPAGGDDISALIKQLGAGEFAQREAATQKIMARGPGVIPQLEKAAQDADPEVATRAKTLLERFKTASKAASVRRLMAIRTLGEMKKPEALPALRPLAESREMFVADYARRAIASIEGKPFVMTVPKEQLEADLNLLPAGLGVVGQVRMNIGKAQTIDNLLKSTPMLAPNQDPAAMTDQMVAAILQVAEMVGNLRVDAVTMGLSQSVGPNEGFVVFIVRGQYDAAAVKGMVVQSQPDSREMVDGAEVLKLDRSVRLILPDDQRLLFLTGASPETVPLVPTLAAIKSGKGEMAANAELVKLISSIDRSGPIWAAGRTGKGYPDAPVINAFDTLVLSSKFEADQLSLQISGEGSPEKVGPAVDMVNKGVAEAQRGLADAVKQMPALKPVVELLASVKCAAEGGKATLTAKAPANVNAATMLPFMIFGSRSSPQPMVDPKP